MPKRSINLLIKQDADPPSLRKLKRYLPPLALVSFVVFLLLFSVTFFYIRANAGKLKQLQGEAEMKDNRVAQRKKEEGLYIFRARILQALGQLQTSSKKYTGVLSEIQQLGGDGVEIINAKVEVNVNVSLVVNSVSYRELSKFVSTLLEKDKQGIYTLIQARSIVRDDDGTYTVTIAFKPDKQLFL